MWRIGHRRVSGNRRRGSTTIAAGFCDFTCFRERLLRDGRLLELMPNLSRPTSSSAFHRYQSSHAISGSVHDPITGPIGDVRCVTFLNHTAEQFPRDHRERMMSPRAFQRSAANLRCGSHLASLSSNQAAVWRLVTDGRRLLEASRSVALAAMRSFSARATSHNTLAIASNVGRQYLQQ